MKENEEITNLERFELLIEDCKGHRELYGESSVGEYDIEIMQHILSDYKRVLKENEKYKRLARMNLKNAEEFKNNMCKHRCLLKNENKEQKELIEKMKAFLLKENKMCDFLESEE